MGLTNKNKLRHYSFGTNVERNNSLRQTITNDGVKYTFNFSSPMLLNNSSGTISINNTTTDLASRTGLCQIDEHNFIILSTTMTPGQNNNQYNDGFRYAHGLSKNTMAAIFLNYGCIWGANLDGGGSQSHVYKKNNEKYYRYYDDYGKVQVYANTYNTYGLEREVTDQLYFVEK